MTKFWALGSSALLLLLLLLVAESATADGRNANARHGTGSEKWGYVEVRPKAHMFWWLYKSPFRVEDPNKPWPIMLWLQGGPGASGVGIGNFMEVGPLDANSKPRNSTWLRVADLLFVDNPVGTGFSFVEEDGLVVKTDEEAAEDLTTLLKDLFNKDLSLEKSPLYIVAESYGGKFAVTLGLSALKAIENGSLKLSLGGVVLGDSWISPQDFVDSWGPLLKDLSRLDDNGLQRANRLAETIKQEIGEGKYAEATLRWGDLEQEISSSSNNVDFYNFLIDSDMDPVAAASTAAAASTVASASTVQSKELVMHRYSRYLLTPSRYSPGNGLDRLGTFMNGPIRTKLKIIPNHVTWGGQQELVFQGLTGDFMKPRIDEVDELLRKGVHVTIYNGQLDLICSTKGAESWVRKLKWDGLQMFLSTDRRPLYCADVQGTKGFTRSYKNLHFYWVFMAGHFVPVEQPCLALSMVGNITQSPAHASNPK